MDFSSFGESIEPSVESLIEVKPLMIINAPAIPAYTSGIQSSAGTEGYCLGCGSTAPIRLSADAAQAFSGDACVSCCSHSDPVSFTENASRSFVT